MHCKTLFLGALGLLAGCSGASFHSDVGSLGSLADAGLQLRESGAAGTGSGGELGVGGTFGSAGTPATGGLTGGAGVPSGGSGGVGMGGAPTSGGGGACQPQACANDGTTCGEIPDGCGSVSKCLHKCGAGQTCQAHACVCDPTATCHLSLSDGTSCVTPCCATTPCCDVAGIGCYAPGVCTSAGLGAPGMCAASRPYPFFCPGIGAPHSDCAPGTDASRPPYFCCATT